MPLSSITPRPTLLPALALVAGLGAFAPFAPFAPFAHAQDRRTLDRDDPQARLLAYYSASLSFTSVGLPDARGRLELGGTLGYIPTLTEEERSVGFGGTKTESSNTCPVFLRLLVGRGFGGISVEAGWTPPATVCGVQANVLAAAVSAPLVLSEGRWTSVMRLSGVYGTVDGSFTCDEEAVADAANLTCYQGTPSDDRLGVTQFSADVMIVYEGWTSRRLRPYALFGTRGEWLRFDVNYTRSNGTPPPNGVPAIDDHERLKTTYFRVQLGAGAAWDVGGRLRLGGEVLYLPGAMVTARGRATIALGSGQ